MKPQLPALLIVEDNDLVNASYKVLFKRLYDLTFAKTIKGAKKLLRQRDFNLMIVDWTLPDGTGDTLANYAIPKILTTGHRDIELIPGFNAIVYKPYDLNIFESLIAKLISSNSQHITNPIICPRCGGYR